MKSEGERRGETSMFLPLSQLWAASPAVAVFLLRSRLLRYPLPQCPCWGALVAGRPWLLGPMKPAPLPVLPPRRWSWVPVAPGLQVASYPTPFQLSQHICNQFCFVLFFQLNSCY